jgi:hypothetical protein
MWTISSSHADGAAVRPLRALPLALLTASALAWPLAAQVAQLPPDAPRVRVVHPVPVLPPQIGDEWLQPVELRSVRALPLDSALRPVVGEPFASAATDPVVIEVRTARPLDPTPRTSWPVVVLNGEPIVHSVVSPDSLAILYGFLPDRSRIRERNVVEVYWVGNEALTRTRQPLILMREQLPGGQ